MLAAGAIHEGKCDSQGAPLVLEELSDAIGMEDMPALQLDTRLFGELTCVANAAKFCLWRQATCQTFGLQAGQTSFLTLDTCALMTAAFGLAAKEQVVVVFDLKGSVVHPFVLLASRCSLTLWNVVVSEENSDALVGLHSLISLSDSGPFSESCC